MAVGKHETRLEWWPRRRGETDRRRWRKTARPQEHCVDPNADTHVRGRDQSERRSGVIIVTKKKKKKIID